MVVSGSVTECTLLQVISINKVKVELKGIKRDAPVIALAETSKVKGIEMEAGIYCSVKGRLEIFLTSTVNKDIMLKKDTQLGLFQMSSYRLLNTGLASRLGPFTVEASAARFLTLTNITYSLSNRDNNFIIF